MIDAENLRTASVYINNQLLSRGLIRDGEEIDFADPTRRGRSSGSSSNGLGKEEAAALGETMGRVMSVVNDLILRRDVSSQPTVHIEVYAVTILRVQG